jgi:hypothetical protein
MIKGINAIKVTMMPIKELIREALKNKKVITKAATAKATPTP